MGDDRSKRVAEAIALLCAELADQASSMSSASDIEAATVTLIRDVGRRVLTGVLQGKIDAGVDAAKRRGLTVDRSPTVTFVGLYGPMELRSPYLHRRGEGARPARDIGVVARGRTRGVERALADFGAEEAYAPAARRFEEHYGFEVGRTTILRVVEKVAGQAAELMTKKIGEGLALFDKPLAENPGVPEMLAEMDGCELRTGRLVDGPPAERTPVRGLPKRKRTTEWRDVRLAFARPMGEVEPTFAGGLAPYAEITRGLFGVAALRGLTSKTKVVAVADGGNGLKEALAEQFPDMQFILDWPHFREHVIETALAMGLEGDDKERQIATITARVEAGHHAVVLAELEAYEGPGKERVERLHNHLTRFADSIHYDQYKERGWPIGSGEIESGHRYVPQKRLKLPGTWWTETNLKAMLALRIVRANGWWGTLWQEAA